MGWLWSISPPSRKWGDTIYFEAFGIFQLGLFGGHYIICQDGEFLEREALDEVAAVGVQTWEIVWAWDG
jgi:DNA polymerase V